MKEGHNRSRIVIPERIRRLWGIGDGDPVFWILPETRQREAPGHRPAHGGPFFGLVTIKWSRLKDPV